MARVSGNPIDLHYLQGVELTAQEQLLFTIAGDDQILEELDFYTCHLAQKLFFANSVPILWGENIWSSQNMEQARLMLVHERVATRFPLFVETIDSLYLQYGQNISPESLLQLLENLSSTLENAKRVSGSIQMQLMTLMIVEDAIALNDDQQLTATSTQILQDIKNNLLADRLRFQVRPGLANVSAMLSIDFARSQLPLMVITNEKPAPEDVLHELVHFVQVLQKNSTEAEYSREFVAHERQAYDFSAAFVAHKFGFAQLQQYEEKYKSNKNEAEEYLTQVRTTRTSFLTKLQNDPENRELRAKIFVNFLTDRLNGFALVPYPQHIALQNYRDSVENHQTIPSAAEQSLDRSILWTYNKGYIGSTLKLLWDGFLSYAKIVDQKNINRASVTQTVHRSVQAQVLNERDKHFAQSVADFYIKALFDDDINEVLAQMDEQIFKPLQTKIYMQVF